MFALQKSASTNTNKVTLVPLGAHKINDSTVVIEELDKCIAEFEDNEDAKNTSQMITSPNAMSTNSSYISNIEKSINDEASPKMSATIETIEFIDNRLHNLSDASFKSPDQNNNNTSNANEFEFKSKFMMKNFYSSNGGGAQTLPNKLSKTSLTSSASQPPPPPPPPPMPANSWLSLNANSNTSKNFLRSKNQWVLLK